MALIDTAWDETSPAGSDDPRDGDDEIRGGKAATRQGLINGGHKWETTPTAAPGDPQRGRHATNLEDTDVFNIYESDFTTVCVQVNDNTKVMHVGDGTIDSGTNPYTLRAEYLSGIRYSTISVPITAGATGVVEGIMIANLCTTPLRIIGAQATAFVAPDAVAGCTIDVQDYTISTVVGPGAAGPATIFNVAYALSIAQSQFASSIITAFDTPLAAYYDLDQGHALRFDIGVLNNAAGLSVLLHVRRIA